MISKLIELCIRNRGMVMLLTAFVVTTGVWSIFNIKVDAAIKIRMDTLVPAGRGKPRNLMGHRISKFCGSSADKDCELIDPIDYDSATGLVKAVGSLSAKTSFVTTRTLAPLGRCAQ